MKKGWLTVLAVLGIAALLHPMDVAVSFNVGINQGDSETFDEAVRIFSYSGKTFRETRHNFMGLGFSLALHVAVLNRLTVVPGFEVRFGHQSFIYEETGESAATEPEKDTYFFKNYSGQLTLHYRLLRLARDWNVVALAGLNYNSVVAEDESEIEDRRYWSLRFGIGTTLFQLKRFAFQLFGYYDLPLDNDQWRYFGAFTGVIYRF